MVLPCFCIDLLLSLNKILPFILKIYKYIYIYIYHSNIKAMFGTLNGDYNKNYNFYFYE